MPTAYIYRGTFEVRAGETLRYVEVAADGTISPEVTKTYAELAGSGSLSAAAVSLTPTIAAPTLTGVQIGAIEGVSVSLQPTVSPAAVSGIQVGSIAAASVSLRPTVAAPSVTGVRVGTLTAAAVSLQPSVATGALTGVTAQTGSISAAAVSCRPTVAVGTLTGVTASGTLTESFTNAGSTLPYVGAAGTWTGVFGVGGVSISGGRMVISSYLEDPEVPAYGVEIVHVPMSRSAEKVTVKVRSNAIFTACYVSFDDGTTEFERIIDTAGQYVTFTFLNQATVGGFQFRYSPTDDLTEVEIDEIVWGAP